MIAHVPTASELWAVLPVLWLVGMACFLVLLGLADLRKSRRG